MIRQILSNRLGIDRIIPIIRPLENLAFQRVKAEKRFDGFGNRTGVFIEMPGQLSQRADLRRDRGSRREMLRHLSSCRKNAGSTDLTSDPRRTASQEGSRDRNKWLNPRKVTATCHTPGSTPSASMLADLEQLINIEAQVNQITARMMPGPIHRGLLSQAAMAW